jgi:cob(I)alamin adenosyltransferase
VRGRAVPDEPGALLATGPPDRRRLDEFMRIYTRKGDDGTTGLLYGGRVSKTSPVIVANGSVDEAQAVLGAVRAEVDRGSELDDLLVGLERDLYVLMADVATAPANRHKLTPGTTLVTPSMVAAIEAQIDELTHRFPPIKDFVIPGHNRIAAGLDVARTVVRRAERDVVLAEASRQTASLETASLETEVDAEPSLAAAYLNRLSDLVWTMARWQEDGASLLSRRSGAAREES